MPLKTTGDWLLAAAVAFAVALIVLGVPPLRRRGWHFLAWAGCLGIAAGSFLLLGRDHSSVANAAQAWLPTSASVWKSQRTEASDGAANDSTGFEIGYLYQAGGKTYSGDRLTLGTFDESEATTESLIEAFPVGRTITIYYDPADPQRSVVWRGESNVGWIAQLVGAALVIPAAALAWCFVRRWRATSPGSDS